MQMICAAIQLSMTMMMMMMIMAMTIEMSMNTDDMIQMIVTDDDDDEFDWWEFGCDMDSNVYSLCVNQKASLNNEPIFLKIIEYRYNQPIKLINRLNQYSS